MPDSIPSLTAESPQPVALSPQRNRTATTLWAGPILVAAATIAMLVWSWGTWPDVQIDFGQQLYVPWQLAEGQVLYRDIAWHHGPLSPYLNALAFRLFGVSLLTLVICNLVILAALICLIYRMLAKISNPLSATVACLFFITVFAFGQQVGYGNYNFVCPYEHGITHGITLSLAAIYGLWAYRQHGSWIAMAATGFALGLVFLTKAEVFVAAFAAVMTGLALTLWSQRPPPGRLLRLLALFLGFSMVPPLVAFGLFCFSMSPTDALLGTLGPWPAVLHSDASQMTFHRAGMGVDNAAENVVKMLRWSGWYAIVFLPAGGLAFLLRRPGIYRLVLSAVVFVVLGGFLARQEIVWSDPARVLPIVMVALALVSLVRFVIRRSDPQISSRMILRFSLAVFALALLGKIILNVRTYHYGFALTMPAALLLVVLLVGWIPAWLNRAGGYGGLFLSTSLAVLSVAAYAHLDVSRLWFAQKKYTVAHGSDAFKADIRGKAVNIILEEINRRAPKDATLAVLPDGAMINYLSRRTNPTPYLFFAPTALAINGQDRMLHAFESNPPDYIVLFHKDASEFGYKFFGQGYGEEIMSWIRRHYRRVKLVGRPPLRDQRFGIALLQRQNAG